MAYDPTNDRRFERRCASLVCAQALVLGLIGCGAQGGDGSTRRARAPSASPQSPAAGSTGAAATMEGFPATAPDAGGNGGSVAPAAGGADEGGQVETNVAAGDPLLGGGAPEGQQSGCNKVDFLFIVDNSGSMEGEQQNLINSFGGFIDTIRSTVAAQDHHVLVTDTDASGGGLNTSCSIINGVSDCSCSPSPACCDALCAQNPSTSCNGAACGALPPADECNATLGAGKVFRQDGTRCLPDTPRFMTQADPDLDTHFACVAEVGTFGDGNEQPMAAMLAALGPLAAPGQCNEGFLRDDAILVVTFITDEEDLDKSPGDPAGWASDLTAIKGGNPKSIVVLGVIGDGDKPGGLCPAAGLSGNTGAEPSPRLRAFVEDFDFGLVGSVCAADYAPFLKQAVSVIDSACDQFTL